MIFPSELKLRNWVTNLNGEYFQINRGADIDAAPWLGIKITKDILKKCGFRFSRDMDTVQKKLVDIIYINAGTVQISFVSGLVLLNGKDDVAPRQVILDKRLEFLHQLQNLYYFISGGEELPVKL